MYVTEGKTGTLRAQTKHHEPIVLAAIEGNGARPSHRGGGINTGEVMFTLNTIERHGVVVSESKQREQDKS